jgi:hypothetical protein
MTEFEKFARLYRRRADVQEGEITVMEGWRDAFAAGRRARGEECEALRDRLNNGIKYDADLNAYILVWTKLELEHAKKEADELMTFFNKPEREED